MPPVLHCVQATANSCAVACVAMALQARGRSSGLQVAGQQLPLTARGATAGDMVRALCAAGIDAKLMDLDPTDPKIVPWLRALLNSDRLIIAQVFAAEMAKIAASRGLCIGPHGTLPTGPGWLHVVVLASATSTHFAVHDPWFGDGQPMQVQAVELAAALQSAIVVVP